MRQIIVPGGWEMPYIYRSDIDRDFQAWVEEVSTYDQRIWYEAHGVNIDELEYSDLADAYYDDLKQGGVRVK